MPRLFYGNFDFEETLAQPAQPALPRSRQRSASMLRLLAELAPMWVALAEEGDLIWCPEPIDPAFFRGLAASGQPRVRGVSRPGDIPGGCDFVPWGWTEEALQFATKIGAKCDAPPLAAVRNVNSRSFSHVLEREAGSFSVRTMEVTTEKGLLTAVESLAGRPGGWVVKAEFGNASRERYHHMDGRTGFEQVCAWAARRLAAGLRLYVEPWLDRISEVGIQWDVPLTGEPVLVGVTGLMTDDAGRFRGCDFTPGWEDDPRWQPAIEASREAARRARSLGYFGPLGVDAMCYRDSDGQTRLRVFQDVNARWTMGRLSLAFRPLLNEGERGCWLQGDAAEAGRVGPGSRTILTSPETINGRPPKIRHAVVIDKTS